MFFLRRAVDPELDALKSNRTFLAARVTGLDRVPDFGGMMFVVSRSGGPVGVSSRSVLEGPS